MVVQEDIGMCHKQCFLTADLSCKSLFVIEPCYPFVITEILRGVTPSGGEDCWYVFPQHPTCRIDYYIKVWQVMMCHFRQALNVMSTCLTSKGFITFSVCSLEPSTDISTILDLNSAPTS